MMIDKASNSPVVNFRGTDNYFKVDSQVAFMLPGSTQLLSYKQSSSGDTISNTKCGSDKSTFLYQTSPEVAEVHYNNRLFICAKTSTGTLGARYFDSGGTADTSLQLRLGEACNTGKIHCDQLPKYDAFFNFVPNAQVNFPQGTSGNDNYKIGTKSQSYLTEEYRLTKGQSLIFDAKYGDGTQIPNEITKKQIRVRSCDKTCAENIVSGVSCNPSSNKVLCVSSGSTCPTGTNLVTSVGSAGQYQCSLSPPIVTGYSSISKNIIFASDLPICREGGSNLPLTSKNCYSPSTNNAQYKSCTNIKDVSGCYQWGSTQTATGGLLCYVGGSVGSGVGELKCSVSGCSLNDKQAYPNGANNEYQNCIQNTQGCTEWGSKQICPTGLLFDSSLDKCVCPSGDGNGVPGDTVCLSTTSMKKYTTKVISNEQCIATEIINLPAGSQRKCINGAFTCDYVGGNKCNIGEVQCGTTSTTYKECGIDTNNPDETCRDFRVSKTTQQGYICQDNTIIQDPRQGCAYDTQGFECNANLGLICGNDIGLSSNDINWNKCVCNNNLYILANFSDIGDKRCSNNKVQKVEIIGGINPIGGDINSCYQWIDDVVCSDANICRQFELLADPVTVTASCISKFENIAIITKDAYKIREKIDSIIINITGNVDLNIVYRAQLYLNNINGTRLEVFSGGRMSQGTAILNFNYAPTSTQKLLINLEACGGSSYGKVADCINTQDYINEQQIIEVKKSFDLKLYCPIINYVNEIVKCTWEPTDLETNALIQINVPVVSVMQGDENLISQISSNSLTFTPTKIGSVTVKVTAEADDYISDINQMIVEVSTATTTSNFKIDNIDYGSVISSGVDLGTRSFSFSVMEGNTKADVNSIRAEILTPTGQVTPITFNKIGDEWKANYNFETQGQKYILRGEIIFSDINKQSIPFSYDILTLSAISEKEKSITTSVIIGVSVGVFVLIVVIVVIMLVRRRK